MIVSEQFNGIKFLVTTFLSLLLFLIINSNNNPAIYTLIPNILPSQSQLLFSIYANNSIFFVVYTQNCKVIGKSSVFIAEFEPSSGENYSALHVDFEIDNQKFLGYGNLSSESKDQSPSGSMDHNSMYLAKQNYQVGCVFHLTQNIKIQQTQKLVISTFIMTKFYKDRLKDKLIQVLLIDKIYEKQNHLQ
ncbi:hypothetical protein ABPG72_019905 [Tetrahymena utriculariae]